MIEEREYTDDYYEERGYRGNQNIRPKGQKQEWTEWQIVEFIKCSKDPIYFIKNYVKIVHVDHGIIPFELWDFQEQMIDKVINNRFSIHLFPRQSGKSTTIASYMLHYVLFNANKLCAILANKADSAREILGRIQESYENLPFWLKMGVEDWNKGSFTLENGSKIIAAATSSSAIRGKSCNIILLDEYAFVPKNIADQFYRSVYPVISSGTTTKLIMVSTPFGMNHFYKIWNEATQNINGFAYHRVFWNQIPGRDAKWKEETIKKIGEEAFRQEFEGEFLGSAGTLISPEKLKSLSYRKPTFEDIEGLKMYAPPERGHHYFVLVDTSEGLGQDYHVITVVDITKYPYNQALVFRNPHLDPLLLPDVIFSLGTKYNEARVLIELNSMGQQVATILRDELEYENIMTVIPSGRLGQVLGGGHSSKVQHGVKMTKQVKRVGCQSLKTLIENDKLIINDFDTYSELTTFVRNKGSYEAESGSNDDTVMALVLLGWAVTQKYFKEDVEQELRKNINRDSLVNIDEMMLPFGFMDDGTDVSKDRKHYDYDVEFVSSSFFD